MLFAVCLDRVEVADAFGPLYRLLPRATPRVADAEMYVLFDDAPTTYRGHRLGFRSDLQGRRLPRRLDAAAWTDLHGHPQDVVRLLVANGFGTGWGDVLIGSALLDLIHRAAREAGKEARVDFLLPPRGSDRRRHLEIYKLHPGLDRIHFTALPLEDYLAYDFCASTEDYTSDPRFTQTDVFSFFLERLGLGGRGLQPRLRLYPDPAVLAEVAVAVGPWRDAPAEDPVLLVNFFATAPRAVPRTHWEGLVRAFAPAYRLAFAAEGSDRQRLAEFLAGLPEAVRVRCRDFSAVTAAGFDHLVGVVAHGCDAVLTADTSVLHVCGGLHKPCLGLFFTIEPEHRIRYYPTVAGYCHPDWRAARFWGLSKSEEPGVQDSAEVEALWRGIDLGALRSRLEEVRRRPAPPEAATTTAPLRPARAARRPRVLAYSGWAFRPGVERDDFTGLLPLVLPGDCAVDVARLRPLEYRPLADYDLVLFGLGDYLDEAVLAQPGLVPFFRAAPRCLGVFGLRHRDTLPADALRGVLGRLEGWFTPLQIDLESWGEHTHRPAWLGEWRARATPPGTWDLDRELVADEASLATRPWDEARRLVQRYRRVRCGAVATLLAALGAAEETAWQECPDRQGREAGVLGRLLGETLGREVPAGVPVPVAPGADATYRAQVAAALATLREVIGTLLGGGPAAGGP